MRVQFRRLRPGELDHELLWLLVSVAAAGSMALWLALHLPWPLCTFRSITGLPCFTCGSTRAGIAFLQGDLGMAWRFNPLMSLAMGGMALFDLYALGVLLTGAPRLRIALSRFSARGVVALLGAAALVNWIYLLRQ